MLGKQRGTLDVEEGNLLFQNPVRKVNQGVPLRRTHFEWVASDDKYGLLIRVKCAREEALTIVDHSVACVVGCQNIVVESEIKTEQEDLEETRGKGVDPSIAPIVRVRGVVCISIIAEILSVVDLEGAIVTQRVLRCYALRASAKGVGLTD